MTLKFARPLVRFTLLAVLASAAGGCSTLASLDPTGLLSDDASPSPSDQFPSDASVAQPSDAGTTPDLASLPARPATPSTAAQQQQMAQAVTADGTQAQASADALRAGTEAAAPPPGSPAPVMMAAAPPTASDAPPTAGDAAPPTASANDAPPTASDTAPSARAPVGVAGAVPAVGPPVARAIGPEPSAADKAAAAAMAAAPAPAPAPTAVASATPGGEPAVPAVPAAGGMAGSRVAVLTPPVVTDAQLGFKPSAAPPLDPSISNWVSAPILAHYRQTASLAGSAGTSSAAVPAVPEGGVRAASRGGARGVGGPDMSGAVVANLDALSSTAAGAVAANYGGVPPTAIVYFAGDGTTLSPAARSQVRQAVAAFKASGGVGMVRVVGHASSRTANMPVERHLEAIFEKSQKRASAVANELIHEGVPAAQVNIEAVGDSQPIYYESMPKVEDGNRRAEIFVQS